MKLVNQHLKCRNCNRYFLQKSRLCHVRCEKCGAEYKCKNDWNESD